MIRLAGAVAVTLAAAGCASHSTYETPYAAGETASATLAPTQGSTVSGSAMFVQRGDKVFVSATVKGLAPNTEHGFHVHDKGDCGSPDGMSAGGHFNPAGKPHGGTQSDHHAGDMPNLKSDASGVATAKFELTGVTVGSGPADIVGRGLIVHRDADDYKSQPAGNAGPRLACAVIRKS